MIPNIGMDGKNREINQIIYNEPNLPCLLMESFFGMSGRGVGIFSGVSVKKAFSCRNRYELERWCAKPHFHSVPFSLGGYGHSVTTDGIDLRTYFFSLWQKHSRRNDDDVFIP